MCPRSCRSLLATLIVGMAAGLSPLSLSAAPIVAGFERFGRHADEAIDRIEAGLLLLGELGCVNCHRPGDREAQVSGKAGPILDRVGERIDPAWIATYLRDPAAAPRQLIGRDILSCAALKHSTAMRA